MDIEWLGHADIETYKLTKRSLHNLLPTILEDNHKSRVRAMIRDCEYVIDWLETGRRPGNKRGVERLAAYQREIPTDIMEKYANKPKPVEFHDDKEYVHMEYILALLTDRERECYEMHVGGQYSMREVARMIGVSMQAVCENVKRAENKIKRYKTQPMPMMLDIVV